VRTELPLTTLDFCEAESRCLVTLRHFLLDEENSRRSCGNRRSSHITVFGHESRTRQLLKCTVLEVNSGSILGNSVNDHLIMSQVPKEYSLPGRTDRCTCVHAIMIMDFDGAQSLAWIAQPNNIQAVYCHEPGTFSMDFSCLGSSPLEESYHLDPC
jgi:hypothetical protein